MDTLPVRRHALGLPAGSIRAAHILVIVGLMCALIINPRDLTIAIPAYLIYLLFLILGHFFASHGTTIASRNSGQPSPLHLPSGSVRLLIILALGGAIGWKMTQNPDALQQQFVASLEALKDQPYLPILILGAFFVGVMLRTIVGSTNPPQWLQDFEAWVSIVALVGLGIAAVIHLVVTASLEVPYLPLPTWEGILGAVIAFYFGERS
jgi:hypothetical protein